jgi:acyl carrier protein
MSQPTQYLTELTDIFRFELDDPKLKLTATDSRDSVSNWDSLAHVRIVAAIERKFGIQFELEEIEDSDTVAKLSVAIARHASGN